jgi:hypothetical protein
VLSQPSPLEGLLLLLHVNKASGVRRFAGVAAEQGKRATQSRIRTRSLPLTTVARASNLQAAERGEREVAETRRE